MSGAKLEEIQELTWRTLSHDVMSKLLEGNPLLDRLDKSLRAEEARKWLSGAPDVSMGISYEMIGWGQA